MGNLTYDLRFAWRMMLRSPGFTAVAILSLALGIGANTAVFSLINAVMLRTLPVQEPERLVVLTDPSSAGLATDTTQSGRRSLLSYFEFDQLRACSGDLFTGIFAAQSAPNMLDVGLEAGGEIGKAQVKLVSGDYFSVLGISAVIGRVFTAAEDRAEGASPVGVISYGYWMRRLGGDPSFVGRSLRVGRNAFTVLGVTPPAFLGEAVGQAPDLWIPMTMQRQVLPGRSYLTERDTLWLQVVARLRPGVSRQQAEAGINVAFQQILQGMAGSQLTPDERKEFLDQRIQLTEGAKGVSTIRGNFSEPLMLLMAIVGAVLLIACANVANLLLARATARQKEIGIRLALGASGGRLMRQLLTESVFLAAVGGALGCLVAACGSYLLLVIVSNGDPTIPLDLHPDLRVLAFSATVSVLTGILFGLAPAIGALRSDVHAALKSGARGVTGAPARFFAGKTFVVLQVAVSMVLLVGASLLLRSLHNLMTQNLGYGREHLLLVRVDPVPSGYKGQQVASLYSRLLERVQAIPGVQAVSLSRSGLFTGDSGDPITVEGYTPQREQDKYAAYDQVGPNYFHTLGIPVLRGRDIGPQDTAKSPQVGVINETMARFYFPHTDPIGKHITDEFPTTRSTFEVVGVVADAREHRLRGKQERRFYVPFFHPIGTVDYAMFVVRTAGNPENIVAAIRHETREIDRTLSIVSIRTLDETLKRRLVQDRLIAQLATVFGALALLLTAIGLYGVMAYAVGRRTNEIGIRMALGAASGNVIRMVLGEAARVAGIGLTIGLPAALAATKLISSRLFGLTATDPLTIGGAILVIASVSLLAGYLPARRAARVDPMLALRCE